MHHWFAKLEPFSVAIKKGIKKDYWWWPVLDLMCKYTLVLTVVYLKRQKVLITIVDLLRHYYIVTNFSDMIQVLALINVLALILLQLLIHPYKNKMANYLESFALLVLIVLLGLGNTPAFIEVANVVLWPLFYLPVLAEFIVISAYVGFILWYV